VPGQPPFRELRGDQKLAPPRDRIARESRIAQRQHRERRVEHF
jgi:hypothetical protein